jgi:hypothetical protein
VRWYKAATESRSKRLWFGLEKEEEVPKAEEEEEKGRMGKLGEGNRAKDLAGETDFNSLCAKSEKIT